MRKLLFIDDEEHNLLTLEVALRKHYKVFTLADPLQAMEIIEKENINVIITDQRMPGITGLELSKRINLVFPSAIIVILTAYDDNESMMQAINQGGIFRYLLKPWDIRDITLTLESAFETYDLRQKNINLINSLLEQNQELIRQEEKFRLIFENSPQGIAHLDSNGIITQCNSCFANIVGPDRDKIIGEHHGKVADLKLEQSIETLYEGKKASVYTDSYHSPYHSSYIPVRVQLTPVISRNKLDGCILIIEDLSEKIKQEELRKQIALVKESARFKQNFLANMSHEIRTPLTGVIGMTDILRNTPLSLQQQEYLEILRQSGEDLREIINQVLDFSKIEAGRVTIKTSAFPFKKLAERAGKLFNSICKKEIIFKTLIDSNIPALIIADEVRLMQIINNLISNAVKFTESGSIEFNAQLLPNPGFDNHFKVKISVTDTGKGIQAEQQGLLFTPFTQIDDHDTRKFEGTGLGLSICRELAKLHGGETGLESTPGVGSSFWFTFRARYANDVEYSKEPENNVILSPPENLNILLAEDKATNQKVFSLLLGSMGFDVIIASNGEEVVELYHPGRFDIILMDIQMPVLNGIEATRVLREKFKKLPPIIGLSANAFEGDREKYMNLGMDEYLTKPLKKQDLIRVLNKFNFSGHTNSRDLHRHYSVNPDETI